MNNVSPVCSNSASGRITAYLERAGNVVWYVKRPTSLWEGDKSTWFT